MATRQISVAFDASARAYLYEEAASRGVSVAFVIREIVDLHRQWMGSRVTPAQPRYTIFTVVGPATVAEHNHRRSEIDPLEPRC